VKRPGKSTKRPDLEAQFNEAFAKLDPHAREALLVILRLMTEGDAITRRRAMALIEAISRLLAMEPPPRRRGGGK
jgi:hypothetical protein